MSLPGLQAFIQRVLGTGADVAASAASTSASIVALIKGGRSAATYMTRGGSAATWLANAIFDDTGPLAAQEYEMRVDALANIRDVNGWNVTLQHRNAANNGNIATELLFVASQEVLNTVQERHRRWLRFTLALNERVRIVEGAGVGTSNAFTSLNWTLIVRPV